MLNKKILTLMFVVAFLFVGCLPMPTTPVIENQAPSILSTPVTTATVGVAYTYDVNATDPDDDTLTYSLTVKPPSMTINSATGVISWTPPATQVGDKAVEVKVSDGTLSDTQSFTIRVSGVEEPEEEPTPTPTPIPTPTVNHAPVITLIPSLTAILGDTFTYDVEATDTDGDTLTYSLTTKPGDMTIVSATGVISWTPNATGSYDVTVEVSDDKLSDTQPFAITVVTVGISGIEVDPDKMFLFVGVSKTIESVTATYEIKKVLEATIALEDCTYTSSPLGVATVDAGVVTGEATGGTTITVTYAGETDEIAVTVLESLPPVHNIIQGFYYNTIQAAIDDVSTLPGDTITVAAGTYNEAVSIDKQLTLLGAQYDVDPTVEGARLDELAESVIDAGGSSAVIMITADSVIVNGFTITNGGGGAPSHLRGGVYLSGTLVFGCTISNNKIVENLRDGIDSCSSGSGVNVFENNVISDNGYGAVYLGRNEGGDIFRNNVISYNADSGETGQIGIQSSDNIVEDNTINGDSLYGILIMGSPVDIRENNILRRNIINRGESGPGFTVGGICITYAKNTIVEDNTIHNNVTGVSVGGSTDTTSLRGNDIQGNDEYGIKVGYPNYDTKDTTIEQNDVLSNEVGIWIRSDIAASTTHINQNNIVGNTNYGMLNETSTIVDATNNWWGSEFGPKHEGFPALGGDAVSDNVDYEHWYFE